MSSLNALRADVKERIKIFAGEDSVKRNKWSEESFAQIVTAAQLEQLYMISDKRDFSALQSRTIRCILNGENVRINSFILFLSIVECELCFCLPDNSEKRARTTEEIGSILYCYLETNGLNSYVLAKEANLDRGLITKILGQTGHYTVYTLFELLHAVLITPRIKFTANRKEREQAYLDQM